MPETRVLFEHIDAADGWELETYTAHGGYDALRRALSELTPEEVVQTVKDSGLRGRGGAGFPTGLKWGFIPKDPALTKHLCVNADESEPGTFSNRQLMECDPHQLVEGVAISAYAIGCSRAYIYLRGEFTLAHERLSRALEDARRAGYIGPDALGSGFDVEISIYRGAGAYICGEETALLESMEGNRPMPRSRPPFPAVAGLYGQPTVINNVETLCNVPHIIKRGVEWYRSLGTEKSPGTKVYSLSGHVARPGNYEAQLGTPLRELVYELAGGVPGDRPVKAVIPGGTSTPMAPAAGLDMRMDYEGPREFGTMLGSTGVIVMDDTVCIPCAVARMMIFYNHESCGKCTPCREGTMWLRQVTHRVATGQGRPGDLETLEAVSRGIEGKTLCALGDFAIGPVLSSIKHFREEWEHHILHGTCLAGRDLQASQPPDEEFVLSARPGGSAAG
jgi:NADH-quinone oxidoreductase subunit F